MNLAPNTIVELRYTGKKIPFKFANEQMKCKSLYWEKRGDVAKCEYADALVLTRGSGDDFKIVNPELVVELPSDQHRRVVEEMPETIPASTKRGRPRKVVQDAAPQA